MRRLARRPILLLLTLAGLSCRGEADAPGVPTTSPVVDDASDASRDLPADSVTVVFFGDSLTEGFGLAGGKSQAYPAVVGRLAADEGVPLRVVNAGISGNTTAEGRARIGWTLQRATPDVFVLALGGNDGLRGLPPAAMRENLRAILVDVRARAPEALILVAGMEAPPNYGGDYTSEFRDVFPALAEEFDAELLPFLLEGVAGDARLNQFDRIHPTAAGHQEIAELVWEELEPMVVRSPGGEMAR
jgi:acyl-CoA thioesterase-1